MSEDVALVTTPGQQTERAELIRFAPVLGLQRTAVRAFLEAERTRSTMESMANAAYSAAVSKADDAATFHQRAAAEILERVEMSAQSSITAASERKEAAVGEEIQPALKQANDAHERALPALARIGMGWVAEPQHVYLPAASDAATHLREAAARTEAAVQPVIDAVQTLDEWRRTESWLLKVAATVIAIVLTVGFIVQAANQPRADGQSSSGVAAALPPDAERAALADIRRTVRYIDDVSPSLSRRYVVDDAGSSGTAYLDNETVRRIVFRHGGWVTETYYSYGDVVFRYEHVPQPSDPTDGLRYYFRVGVPFRLRHDTINLVPGTVQYTGMNADSVRAVALQQMRDAATWSASP